MMRLKKSWKELVITELYLFLLIETCLFLLLLLEAQVNFNTDKIGRVKQLQHESENF